MLFCCSDAGGLVVSAGTGPVCFLARLCLRAGASEADAVESSETSVQRAVECFRAEAMQKGSEGRSGRWN